MHSRPFALLASLALATLLLAACSSHSHGTRSTQRLEQAAIVIEDGVGGQLGSSGDSRRDEIVAYLRARGYLPAQFTLVDDPARADRTIFVTISADGAVNVRTVLVNTTNSRALSGMGSSYRRTYFGYAAEPSYYYEPIYWDYYGSNVIFPSGPVQSPPDRPRRGDRPNHRRPDPDKVDAPRYPPTGDHGGNPGRGGDRPGGDRPDHPRRGSPDGGGGTWTPHRHSPGDSGSRIPDPPSSQPSAPTYSPPSYSPPSYSPPVNDSPPRSSPPVENTATRQQER